MATEELIVLLDAKTQQLDAKLKATDKKLNRLDKSVTKVDTDFKRMGATMVKGATVAAAAVGVLVNSTVLTQHSSSRARARLGNWMVSAFA